MCASGQKRCPLRARRPTVRSIHVAFEAEADVASMMPPGLSRIPDACCPLTLTLAPHSADRTRLKEHWTLIAGRVTRHCLRYHAWMPIDIRELARVGAQARLAELLAEVEEIRRMFPGIGEARRGRLPASATTVKTTKRGRRRKMSAGERKAVSERMRKYWAARRKEKAKA
jgi:hypothetical protein